MYSYLFRTYSYNISCTTQIIQKQYAHPSHTHHTQRCPTDPLNQMGFLWFWYTADRKTAPQCHEIISNKKDITWYVNSIHNYWLLVWNMFYFPIYWEESSSQVTNSYFSEGLVETTNHIHIYIYKDIIIYDIIFPVGYHWYIIDISMRTMWFSEDHSPFGPWEVLDAGSAKDDADQG